MNQRKYPYNIVYYLLLLAAFGLLASAGLTGCGDDKKDDPEDDMVTDVDDIEDDADVEDDADMMGDVEPDDDADADTTIDMAVSASIDRFPEGSEMTVSFSATGVPGNASDFSWGQERGPQKGIMGMSADEAEVDVSDIRVAVDTEFTYSLTVETDDGETYTAEDTFVITPEDLENVLGGWEQIGGATIAATTFDDNGTTWTLYNNGNRLNATTVSTTQGDVHSVIVPGYIHDVQLVTYESTRYALLAMGSVGIGIVDLTDPTAMTFVDSVRVNYEMLGVTFAEGGGDIVTGDFISTRGPISALYTDGTTLWLADEGYGIHRTALSNLLAAEGPSLEADGTLTIDAEQWTLLYAGEKGWGSPQSITMFNGVLFVAMSELGMGVFDATSLEQIGGYNHYVNDAVTEDFYLDTDIDSLVQSDAGDPFTDDFTGMPDYRQANFEIQQVWHGDVEAPTPWADFDRQGKFYYNAHDVAVADHGNRTIAYIAYGLSGLVAVDVTGYDTATAGSFLDAAYLGYAPGVPAHGPEDRQGSETTSLYPYYGAGKLKEAGVTSVGVNGTDVYYSDHFAGLVVLGNGDQPDTQWRQNGGPFNNDNPNVGDGVLGDHWPDFEWVTSYNMSPWDPEDHESLPQWMYDNNSPSLMVTGEVGGHGNTLLLAENLDTANSGNVDVVQCTGSGGLIFLDIVDFGAATMTDRFSLAAHFPSTDEVGAFADGTPGQPISIGHTQGISSSDKYLYVADGPHGVSAWRITDDEGLPIDEPHLVANTLQDEYPVTVGETTVYPATHASGVVVDAENNAVYSTCQSIGLRRLDVSSVEEDQGAPGTPLLVGPEPTDIYEHNTDSGAVSPDLKKQDHVYDVHLVDNLAFVADGPNGLTIYDISADPTTGAAHLVGNIGGEQGTDPALGRANGLDLWTDMESDITYAFVASGPKGVAVVDVSDPSAPVLIKVFEPIKVEDDSIGKADGRSVDVHVVGEHVYFSYSSFGIVVYTIEDLIAPLPDGVDPTEIWSRQSDNPFDHRPEHLAKFKLSEVEGYEEEDGEALRMEPVHIDDQLTFVVAYGGSGLVTINWTDPANPVLQDHMPTVHEASAVTINNGRIYVADHDGGVAIFK